MPPPGGRTKAHAEDQDALQFMMNRRQACLPSQWDRPAPPTRHIPQSASDSQIISNTLSQVGSWHQRLLRGVRQRRRSPRVRLLQRIVAQQADMPPGVAATRHVGSGWRSLGVPGMLGWGNKALRETRPDAAPGGGRCGGHEAGVTVILRAMLRRYVSHPLPSHSGDLRVTVTGSQFLWPDRKTGSQFLWPSAVPTS